MACVRVSGRMVLVGAHQVGGWASRKTKADWPIEAVEPYPMPWMPEVGETPSLLCCLTIMLVRQLDD